MESRDTNERCDTKREREREGDWGGGGGGEIDNFKEQSIVDQLMNISRTCPRLYKEKSAVNSQSNLRKPKTSFQSGNGKQQQLQQNRDFCEETARFGGFQ